MKFLFSEIRMKVLFKTWTKIYFLKVSLWQRRCQCWVSSACAHISTEKSIWAVNSLLNRTQLTSTTIQHNPSPPNITLYRPTIPGITRYHLSPPITIHYYPSFHIITQQHSLPITDYSLSLQKYRSSLFQLVSDENKYLQVLCWTVYVGNSFMCTNHSERQSTSIWDFLLIRVGNQKSV